MPITINGTGTVTGISAGGLPDGVITTDDIAAGAVTQAKRSEQLTLGTAVASTSGTSIDFTGIPSWAKRVTVMLSGVSTTGTDNIVVRVGAGSITATGYFSGSLQFVGGSTPSSQSLTSGFLVLGAGANNVRTGRYVLENVSGNTWLMTAQGAFSDVGAGWLASGSIALSGTLDRVRITTVNGTDTFDAGSINIMWE